MLACWRPVKAWPSSSSSAAWSARLFRAELAATRAVSGMVRVVDEVARVAVVVELGGVGGVLLAGGLVLVVLVVVVLLVVVEDTPIDSS